MLACKLQHQCIPEAELHIRSRIESVLYSYPTFGPAALQLAQLYHKFSCYVKWSWVYAFTIYMHTENSLHTFTHTYIHTYTYTYIHAYIHTYIYTYIHAWIHTYIHTCMNTYTHARAHTRIYRYNYLIIHSLIHSFILAISIAPLQVLCHSEALPTTARILYRSFTP